MIALTPLALGVAGDLIAAASDHYRITHKPTIHQLQNFVGEDVR
jgi:hypothetical protein